jgi:hypothetical protein
VLPLNFFLYGCDHWGCQRNCEADGPEVVWGKELWFKNEYNEATLQEFGQVVIMKWSTNYDEVWAFSSLIDSMSGKNNARNHSIHGSDKWRIRLTCYHDVIY